MARSPGVGHLKPTRPRLRPTADGKWATADSFANFSARVGIQASNISSSAGYQFHPVTRNRLMLEWAYRGSWIVGMAVDCPAEDMTREGVEIHSDDAPEKIQTLERTARRLMIWQRLCEAIKWARLYGGAVAYLMIDGQKPETPLRLDSIGKDQFKGLLPLDRWALMPSLHDLVTDYGYDIGNPRYYDVVPDIGTGLMRMTVHHTRVIRLEGTQLPYWQRITENYWGQSVVERLWDRLLAFDSTTQGAAQLTYKAHLRTLKIRGLREILTAGGPLEAALAKQVEFIRRFQSNEGMSVIDAEDEFDAQAYSFAGLSDMLQQFGQQISGALQIPLVRLFGQSPQGLNATGDSDWQNYSQGIKEQQESRLRDGVEKVYQVLYRSNFGSSPAETFSLEFRPIRMVDDEQKAEINKTDSDSIYGAVDRGLIPNSVALKELKQRGQKVGAWTNITPDVIDKAEQMEEEAENAPGPEELGIIGPAAAARPNGAIQAGEGHEPVRPGAAGRGAPRVGPARPLAGRARLNGAGVR